MKIFVAMPHTEETDTFLSQRVWDRLHRMGEVTQNPYDRPLTKDEILDLAKDADIMVTGWNTAMLCKADLEQLPKLKLICHTGGSVAYFLNPDIYDLPIAVISGNTLFARTIAEGCLTYTLHCLRRISDFMLGKNKWREGEAFQNQGLIGKTVGIVGVGVISKEFMESLRWFDCEVLIYSSHLTDEQAAAYGGRKATLEEIFEKADVVSLHSSLTPKTEGMISEELLSKLRPHCLLVNTARGGLVDEEAMVRMLQEERFFAALDVFIQEPLPADAPIRKCKNALLMPHMAGSIDAREMVAWELCGDLERFIRGEEMENAVEASVARRMTRE